MNELPAGLHAFTGYGIELEYMIVDREHLSVMPIADRLLAAAGGPGSADVDRGMMGWSNELVLHVIEVKNARPVPSLQLLPQAFQAEVKRINQLLEPMQARLMPAAMHPWMDPRAETRLWPHQNDAIYSAYDRIFDSRSHGWANLQSMHVNLPFAGDREFARLHEAIRLILPILPALAASSPVAEQANAGYVDFRMQVYWNNSDKVPSIAGMVVPESVSSRDEYEERILAPMYRDIEPHDPEHALRYEWLNSRGAIARFDRSAIEIRVIDSQECPHADLAIAAATSFAVKSLYDAGLPARSLPTGALADILRGCIRDAEQTVIDHPEYLALLGFPERRGTAQEVWHFLIGQMMRDSVENRESWNGPLQTILQHGPLARRILRAADGDFSRIRLEQVYRELCVCLHEGRMFIP